MASNSSSTKTKPQKQNHSRSMSLDRMPKPKTSSDPKATSDRKTIVKPLPNYLKHTISSRPNPVNFLKKNNAFDEDNQKLIRRRSFDRPLTSLTTSSSSRKSLSISPRDIPMVPRRSPGAKTNGMRSKKEGSKKSPDKEITPEDKGILIIEDKPEEEPNMEDKLEEEETEIEESKLRKEVVQGEKICPTLYNDVIASKIQDLEKMNVIAFASAFQTVIDYETAASI